MSDQPRLRGDAGRLLSDATSELDRPWSPQARAEALLALEARLERESRPRFHLGWVAAAAAVVLVAAGALLLTRHDGGSRSANPGVVSLGADGTLEVASTSNVELPPAQAEKPGRQVVLKSGRVCAEIAHRDIARQGPLIVEAPNLNVVVIGTHFCVSTEGGVSTVAVTQGRIRAESPSGGSVFVAAGESVRSDDARLAVAPAPSQHPDAPTLVPSVAPHATPPVTPACGAARSLEARRECYTRVARGHDIAAQNALYGLGFLERDEAHDVVAALAAWREYEERFPGGVFAPEASFAALAELLKQQRYPEALKETDRYLATGEEGERARVELVRAQILVGQMAQPKEALAVLQRLAESRDAFVREEALFALWRCQVALGLESEAAQTSRRSLADYPAGKHVAELRAGAQ